MLRPALCSEGNIVTSYLKYTARSSFLTVMPCAHESLIVRICRLLSQIRFRFNNSSPATLSDTKCRDSHALQVSGGSPTVSSKFVPTKEIEQL